MSNDNDFQPTNTATRAFQNDQDANLKIDIEFTPEAERFLKALAQHDLQQTFDRIQEKDTEAQDLYRRIVDGDPTVEVPFGMRTDGLKK